MPRTDGLQPDLAVGTKHPVEFIRISNRTAGAQWEYPSWTSKDATIHAAPLLLVGNVGYSASVLEGNDELRRTERERVLRWFELLERDARRRAVHPMIQYFEGIINDYDSEEVAQGLRRFLELYEASKQGSET